MAEDIWIKFLQDYIKLGKPLTGFFAIVLFGLMLYKKYNEIRGQNIDLESKKLDLELKKRDFYKKIKEESS